MRWIALTIFFAAACLVWLPVNIQGALFGTRSENPVPAGEIGKGFQISQLVHPPADATAPDQSLHPHCFGVRFATYMRRNAGQLAVEWRQGGLERSWRVKAGGLADNSFRYFCPGPGFSAWEPFELRISGINGRPGSSATLWLTGDTALGVLEGNREDFAGRALMLELVERRWVGPIEALAVNRGAFLFGWLCTLLVVAIVLGRTGGVACAKGRGGESDLRRTDSESFSRR